MLKSDVMSVDISGPREGRIAGKRERAYRRWSASREGVRVDVDAWVYRMDCALWDGEVEKDGSEWDLDNWMSSSRVKEACSAP